MESDERSVSRLDPATTRALDAHLASVQTESRAPAVVAALASHAEIQWAKAIGSLDGRAAGEPVRLQTPFRIGSITKTLTAVLVLRQYEAGRCDLQDRLDQHLSQTPYGAATLAQLLSHSAGVPAETSGPWWERSPGLSWEALQAQLGQPVFATGERHHYSNVGFAVLGQLLAEWTGLSWWDLLRRDLLEPLGMNATSYHRPDDAAPGWAVHPEVDLLHPEPTHDAAAMAPAGQLWSTLSDLVRWADFLAGNTSGLLSAETIALMQQPRAVVDEPGYAWTMAHGLGVRISNVEGNRLVGHGGSMPGYVAQLWVDPTSRRSIVAACNSTAGGTPSARELLGLYLKDYPIMAEPWHAEPPPAGAVELAGTWYWGPHPQVLRVSPAGLALGDRGDARADQFRLESGRWIGQSGYFAGEELRPIRGADGVVSHLDIASFRWTRVPYDPAGDIPGGAGLWQ